MLNSLLSSLLIDVVHLLKESDGFFNLETKEKHQILEKQEHFSEGLKAYFEKATLNQFLMDMEELVKQLLVSSYKENRMIAIQVIDLLSIYFDHQVDVNPEALIGDGMGGHYVLVQSPIRLEAKFKDEIKAHLLQKYPNSHPLFVINKNLIGGLRIYVDGKTQDYSWISRINVLTSFNKV